MLEHMPRAPMLADANADAAQQCHVRNATQRTNAEHPTSQRNLTLRNARARIRQTRFCDVTR